MVNSDMRSRRSYLQSVAATGAALALAGCASDGDDNSTGDDGANESGQDGGGQSNGSGGGGADNDSGSGDEQSGGSETAAVGEVVSNETLAMVVTSVESTKKLGEFQEADEGNVYQVVQMEVKNKTSDEFVNFSGFLQSRVKDDEDHVYDQAIASTGSGSDFGSGQLAPGEVERGNLVYEVPESAGGLSLQFDFSAFDLFELDRVTVNLGEEADSMGDLQQDLQVDVNTVGDTVSHEDVTVTLNDVRTTDELGEYTKAEEGKQYVIPDISVENGTSEALNVSISLQMGVKDGEGNSYTVDIGSYSQLDQKFAQGSELAAGETRRGELSYQVLKDAETLYFTFEFSLLELGDKAFWQLN